MILIKKGKIKYLLFPFLKHSFAPLRIYKNPLKCFVVLMFVTIYTSSFMDIKANY
jgi:hypothetical protein